MDPTFNQRVEDLFIEAVGLPAADREAFLASACNGDTQLRHKVDVLLAAEARCADYFDKLPQRLGVANLLARSVEPGSDPAPFNVGGPGQRFGHYTLTELIGHGGMGAVWRAVRSDGRFEGDVAIKLLSLSTGAAGIERFTLEGRYLAKLAHPNIARLIDAGVGPAQQPYLVLEYVEGLAIDQHCDAQALPIEQRIELFLQVLDAVADAHAHLIVHRDIKPSNVCVTRGGAVKLLDFGIAKLLSDEATASDDLTRQIGTALTPQFAAPEQLEGRPITTATDVYSLGLLLWLLIVGRNPRETDTVRSLAELRELAQREPTTLVDAVTDQQRTPEQLQTLAAKRGISIAGLLRTLRGDLDSIVRKAIAIDPQERYATVGDFAQDLRRYLRNEPVTSRINTMRYRVRKFVQRHRGGVLTASLTLIAILGTAAVAVWQGIEARHQRDLALYQQQRMQATNEFMNLLLNEIGPQGKPLSLAELVDHGVSLLDSQYGTEQRFLAPVWYELASSYFSLGRSERLLEMLGRAEQAARTHRDDDVLAATLCTQARVQLRTAPDEARARIEEARSTLARHRRQSSNATSSCARAEALLLEHDGNRRGAIAIMERALRKVESDDSTTIRMRTEVMNELARLYYNERDIARTLDLTERALAAMQRAGLGATNGYLITASNRTSILQLAGEIRQAFEIQTSLQDRIRSLDLALRPVGYASAYGNGLIRLARYEEALAIYEQQLAGAKAEANAYIAAESELQIGRIKSALQRYAEAHEHFAIAERELLKSPEANVRVLQALAVFRAQALLGEGNAARAKVMIDEALQRNGYPQRKDSPALTNLLRIAAQLSLAMNDVAAAERYATDFHETALRSARTAAASADVGQALLLRAKARLARSDSSAAMNDLEAATVSLTNGFGADHPDTLEARTLLAEIQN